MALSSSRTAPTEPSPSSIPSRSLPKKKAKAKVIKVLYAVFRSISTITPMPIMFPSFPNPNPNPNPIPDSMLTGTFFGFQKGRVNFSIQQNPKSLPFFVLELPIQTSAFQREVETGAVRIALECEKRPEMNARLEEEYVWDVFCNGRKCGYAARREATEEDISMVELLNDVSMGFGHGPHVNRDWAYLRANFERIVGSEDSQSLHMLTGSEEDIAPELSVFLVRI